MSDKQTVHDLIIIGSGPASLSAAIYTTREDIDTLILEKGVVGGLPAVTDIVENYPGFPDGIEGLKLAGEMRKHAERFGTKIELAEVTDLRVEDGNVKRLITSTGDDYLAKAVIIATGTDFKKTGIPGEAEYYARGVHYCATCDGAFYRDKRLVVIGGGNSAVQEAMFLTRYASHIDLLVRSTVKATEVMQQEMQEYIDKGQITVHLQTTPKEIVAEDEKVVKVVGTNNDSGEDVEFPTDGVFIFIGLVPNTKFLQDVDGLAFDETGHIVTNEKLETKIPGVYVAGDVRADAVRQIATAAGEGVKASLEIREYLKEHNKANK